MIELVIAVVSGGFVTGILTFLLSKRKQSVDEFKELIDYWKTENARLRALEEKNSEFIQRLQKEVNNMKQKLLLMESAHYDLPLPQWLKDTDGVMLSLNSEYEKTFLLPLGLTAHDYIDKHDQDVWGEEIAKHFAIGDKMIIAYKKPYHTVEPIKDLNGDIIYWEIFKYPRFAGNFLIGIGGIAVKQVKDENTIKIITEKSSKK